MSVIGLTHGMLARSVAAPSLLSAHFVEQMRATYFDLQPVALVLNAETFDAETGQFVQYTEGTYGTFSISGGKAVVTQSSGDRNNIVKTGPDVGQPQAFVSMDLSARSGSPSSYDVVGVGIVRDANNFIWASRDRLSGECRFQIKIGGGNGFHAGVYPSLPETFTLGLSIVGNKLGLWTDTGSGWVLQSTFDCASRIDLKIADLTGWKSGFMLASSGNSTWAFDNLKIGRFGAVGLRDMTLVTLEDGTPYVESGKVYFTATAAAGYDSYCGVFTLDLTTYAVAQTGVLQINRGGVIQNDVAAHIIRYGATDYRMVISTWGNGFGGSLSFLHKLLSGVDLLHGSHVVGGMTALALPGGGAGVYDPMLVKVGSTWHLAYTITNDLWFAGSPFYAALATSPDLATWTLVGKDDTHTGYEATKIVKAGTAYHVVASGPAGVGTGTRVFDLSMAYQGALNATFYGGTDTQPHPMAFAVGSTWYLLTYDNYRFNGLGFTWGRPMVYTA